MKPDNIVISQHPEEKELANVYILSDGVVRFKSRDLGRYNGLWILIVANSEKDINDAQCQATVSTVLASQLTYSIPSEKVRVMLDMGWDELLRRG